METLKSYAPYLIGIAVLGGGIAYAYDFEFEIPNWMGGEKVEKAYKTKCELGFDGPDGNRKFTKDECVFQLQGIPLPGNLCKKKGIRGGDWGYDLDIECSRK